MDHSDDKKNTNDSDIRCINEKDMPIWSVCFPPVKRQDDLWTGTFSSSRYRIFGISYVCGDLSAIIPKTLPEITTAKLISVIMNYRGIWGRGERRESRFDYEPPTHPNPTGLDIGISLMGGLRAGSKMRTKMMPFKKNFTDTQNYNSHQMILSILSREGDYITGQYLLMDSEHVFTAEPRDAGTFTLKLCK